MHPFLICAAFAAALVTYVSTALGQTPCTTRPKMLQLMKDKYGEVVSYFGVSNGGGLIEILTSKENDTWSVIVTTREGWSCLTASGEGWRKVKKVEEEEGV